MDKSERKDCQEFIYILDYSDKTICKIVLDDEDLENENTEAILAKYGVHASSAAWMFSDEDTDSIIELTHKQHTYD